jgi:hypothetical protein
MFDVYKILVTSNTGMQHVDDIDGEWKTVRETNRAIERLCHGPAAKLGLTNEVMVVDALDLVVFHARKGDNGRLAMVRT